MKGKPRTSLLTLFSCYGAYWRAAVGGREWEGETRKGGQSRKVVSSATAPGEPPPPPNPPSQVRWLGDSLTCSLPFLAEWPSHPPSPPFFSKKRRQKAPRGIVKGPRSPQVFYFSYVNHLSRADTASRPEPFCTLLRKVPCCLLRKIGVCQGEAERKLDSGLS